MGLLLLGKPTHPSVVGGIVKRGGDTSCVLAPRPPQLGSNQISGERKLGRGVPVACGEGA